MGRKPNQLILEFFERGPKLEDASNRYQHTCKSCGEKFPKGRLDSLSNHLVKKCPALPLRDRQRALLQFHDIPLGMAQLAAMHGQTQNGAALNGLPYVPSKQGLSALETLAEVSRQHLDLSGKSVPAKGRASPPPPNTGVNQGAFMDEFLIHDDRQDGHDMSAISQSIEASGAPAMPALYQFHGPLQHSPSASPHLSNLPISTSGAMNQMVPSLVMTASAANELTNILPLSNGLPDLSLTNASSSDKFFPGQDRQQWPSLAHSLDPLNDQHRDPMLHRDEGLTKLLSPKPISISPSGQQTHYTSSFAVNQKPTKQKVRGRFSDTRRREVQEIRKRGACIRCRMLKKPCSGESPCNTCKNVESARLWKQPCIRTRIADEFTLYSAGLHGTLTFQAVGQAKGQVRLEQVPGRIEATHHPDSHIFATFAPWRFQSPMAGTEIDPVILASLAPLNLELLDGEDDISNKLDLYVKKAAQWFSESETSAFMETTIRSGLSIASSNPDGLFPKAVELWHLTRILTSRTMPWYLFSNPSLAPTMVPSTMSPSDIENPARTPITPEGNPTSYELITLQLQAATEKRAACLGRVVMNDLERRLLQRQQANPFQTFLIAVILLACVERMCWLFRTWEEEPPLPPTEDVHDIVDPSTEPFPPPAQVTEPQSDASIAEALQSASASEPPPPSQPGQLPSSFHRHPKWPFDRPPAHYSQQGERFSDILNMLLRMRGVPPKPVARSIDDMLVVWGEDVDGRGREWYEAIGLTARGLADRATAPFVGEDPSEWELKYVGKIVGV